MAQKKKASAAARIATTVPSSQEETLSDGAEVPSSENGGRAPRKRVVPTIEPEPVDTVVRGECEKALVALRRGNSTKALRLIKDACSRNESSGLAHRVQGHIFMRLASVIEDANAKQRHAVSALESARKAVELSPQSVEYAHFYAQLLYEAAKDSTGYEEVIGVCERALVIEHPVDPARESLQNEQQQDLPTAEARIEHVHQGLKSLLQKANNISHLPSSISTWMKTLGNGTGEDKLRFGQMRSQDLMEQKVSQPKRPHEVKKVVKTPEERRKEIEVRVAAARLLQQRDPSSAGSADSPGDNDEKSLQKKLDRRKSRLSKPLTTDERIDRVRVFWHSLSLEKRESLLQVTVAELKELHSISVGGLVKSSDVLSEALEFAQENKTWRFWACCQCGARFANVQEFHHHTSEHIGTLPPHIRHYLSEYAQSCGVGSLSEGLSAETGVDDMIPDRLMLTEDFTELLLDERVMEETLEEIGGPAAHRPLLPLMKGEQHMDRQLSWIFGTADYEYQPSGWKQFREEQGQRGRDMYRSLENEFQRLLALCTKRFELVSSEEALNLVERICVVEKNRRVQQFDTGKDLEAVLKERQQELQHLHRLSLRNGGLSFAQESELDAIANVLRDVQTITVRRLLHSGISNDSDEDDEEAWRLQNSTDHTDLRVEAAIARQREHLSIEANTLDPKIMRATDDFQRLEVKLRQFALLDYRAVALPLVKSLLQSRLEGEAEKDAMQKSDAAREAFLAELAKDKKKSSGSKEVENVKQARGKAKEKRKPKDQKKLKHAPSNPEQLGESASVEGDEREDLEQRELVAGDDSKEQLDTEKQHQALLLEEERKLLEALEFQRRLEEETKQKHLDELERRKQASLEIVLQSLEDEADATSTVDVVVDPKNSLPISSLEEPLSVESGCQDPEVADSTSGQILPSLPAQDEHSRPDQILEDSPRIEPAEDHACNKVVEKEAPAEVMHSAGTDGLLKEQDSDHLESFQKKPRGGNNRNRRRKGPRIYAEEGITADQNVAPWKTSDVGNGPRALTEDNTATKSIGKTSTIDQPKPLLRQNASRKFGVAAPANGVNAEQPLLLLPAPEGFEGKKTLRQLQAEQDDEERFQADLEQAMRQSLDMLTSLPTGPSSVASASPIFANSSGILREYEEQQLLETRALGIPNGAVETPLKEVEEVGKGLRNEIGQYNCFLNVVIQSLWHLRRFREELLADSSMQHVHVGDPCVVCALRNVFLGLNTPVQNTSSSKEAVAPTALRVALSALYADSDFFQEAQMNDASEVLAVIFDCLHKAFVPNSSSDGDSESSTAGGSWDCQGQHTCMAHALFGLDIAEQMNCQSCGLESRHLKYTAFFHNINASALRTAKLLYSESSMDELLKLVDMNHQLACDTETGGCGRSNHIHHFLHVVPPVFTIVLGWQNGRESFEDIAATVDAMDAALDVGVIYRGLDQGFQHRLVSVVCYYGQHYHCFAYNREHCRWVMFDDSTVKVIGDWKDVTSTCRRGHLQPQVLFYEAARSEAVTQLLPLLNMPLQS